MGRRNQIVYPCRVEGWLNYYDKEIGPGTRLHDVEWEPYFCVLLQDEQTLTAYRSEELALFPGTIFGMRNRLKIGDALFVELPGYGSTGVPRPSDSAGATRGAMPCCAPLMEEDEGNEEAEEEGETVSLREEVFLPSSPLGEEN
ncbi:ras GTPase-activating protein raskol-like [Nilaparvata lugens]|uniref:ras GTPase-activating protein raskol-like n=1 Tax=Nilaparvata lugens TaxID=108931 RepID=UPI00193E8AE9|nr:ras GTPase-activating protein raskol-like [Nilaparvata lugens]